MEKYWQIFDATGTEIKAEVRKLTYTGEYKSDRYVTATVQSPFPIDFEIGDILVYRDDVFTLVNIPSMKRQGSIGRKGDAIVYEGLRFKSTIAELQYAQFVDLVPDDNHIPYTALGSFSFYVTDLQDFGGRLQACLDASYGEDTWEVQYGSAGISKSFDFQVQSDTSVWNAIAQFSNSSKTNFTIRGRIITLGWTQDVLGTGVFVYGKGNGLKSLTQNVEPDQKVVTRLRAYGSERNIPYRYYNNLDSGITSMYVPRLMLPGFPTQSLHDWVESKKNEGSRVGDLVRRLISEGYTFSEDPYAPCIFSPTIDIYGQRDGEKIFDGSDEEWDEIFPTTTGFALISGTSILDNGQCSVYTEGDFEEGTVDTDGVAMVRTFQLTLPLAIGFNPWDYRVNGETPTLEVTSGMCQSDHGRFEILSCSLNAGGTGYVLTLRRMFDSALNLFYPNNRYQVAVGDSFILTGISMPASLIESASVRLLEQACDWMLDNDHEVATFQPEIDNIFMANHPELGEELTEGMKLTFSDVELGIVEQSRTIKTLVIKEGDYGTDSVNIPKYEVVLSEEVEATLMDKVDARIHAVNSDFSGVFTNLRGELKGKLSRISADTAEGHITFASGATVHNGLQADVAEVSGQSKLLGGVEVGEFQSRFLGKGAAVDAQGNAEFDSIYSRNFISTPEFRFNRIAVTDGEDWCTNGYGTIKEVSNIHTEGDEVVGHAVLHLEENDWASIREGDICRGIFNDIAGEYTEYSSEETGEDDCDIYGAEEDDMQEGHGFGFANKKGFFTSYFYVKHITKNVAGECEFDFGMRTSTTPLPCAFMKFAQYGSFTDSDRQSSSYRSSIGNFFEMTLQGVNTWRIQPENVVARYGWLGDMTITERDGTTRTLEGNGLYVQDNVYFGGGVVQLDPATIEDLADELASYEVDFSEHVDVIQVDDAGNVIGGLWEDSTDGTSTYRNYRIQSAITVRKNGVLLTEAASSADAGKGTFKLYATSHDCTFEISNSTIYIKGINNVKDGVPGSSDDVNFDYDAMREMESVSVDLVVDCEGRGSITKTFAVAIKHTATPFIQQSLDNVSANVSWSVKLQEFIGIPVHIGVRMMKDTVSLPLTYLAIRVGDTIYTQTGTKAAGASSETAGTAHLLSHTSANVGKGNGWRFEISKSAKEIYITDMPVDVDEYPSISILSSVEYAGVTYENESAFTLHKMEDVNVYELWPSQPDIKQHYSYAIGANNAVSRTPVMDLLGNALTAIVSCDDSEGRHYQTSASDLANAGLSVWYALVNAADVEGTKTAMPSAGLTASDIGSAKRVILYLYRNKGQATESVEDYQPVDVLSPTDDYWMELTDNFAVLDEDDNAVVPSSITISPMRRPGTPVEGTLVFRVGTDTTVRHEIEVTSSTSYKGVITSTYLLSLVNRAITQGTSDIHVLLYTDHNKTTLLAVTKIRAMLSAKGDDGPGVEYIFQRTATADGTADAPTYPSSGTAPVNSGTGTVDGVDTEYSNIIDDWVPPAWDDDALSPTAALPYVWASKRKKSNGTWGNFETPKLWNKWAEDGATYDIKTSVDTLAILPDESSVDFMSSIRVYKIQGDVSSLFTCYIQVFKRKPDGTRESIYGPVQHTSAGINRTITDAYEAVEIFASESDTNLTTNYLWKKEIPVIKHGDTGEDASSYRCSWKHAGEEVDVLHADSDGSVQAKSAGSIVVALKKRVGDGAEENGWATNVIVYAEEADGTVYDSFTASANAITISSSSELDSIDESSVVRLRAVFTVGSETIEFVINKVLDGAHGDLGPMLYPAGEWQANTTYTKNGQQVPYVLYNGSYYYLAVDSSNRSSWRSTDWTLVSSFNAVFAQFLIADYGKMSSAIFCGDWCYSQYGKLMTGNGGYYIVDNNGSTPGHINYDSSFDGKLPYMYFDPSDPTGSGATTGYPRFAPAWAVDFKTGSQYGAMGKFKLKDDGSVEIEGTVKAQSFQQSVVDCYYTGNGRQTAYSQSVLLPSQMSDYSENTVFPWLSGNTIRNSMIWDGVSVPSKLYIEDTDSPNNGGSTEIDGQSVVLRSYIYLNLPPACDHLGHEIEIITRVSQAGLSNLEYIIKGGTGPSSEDKLIVPGLGPSSYIYLNPDPNRHRQFVSSGGKISSVRLIAVQWSTYYGWMVLGYNEAYLG